MASAYITTDDLARVAHEHGLVAVSVVLLADIEKYSIGVQWMSRDARECTSGISADPAEALNIALAQKAEMDAETDLERARRIERLRAELARLEGAA